LPETSIGAQIKKSIMRGDLTGSSFAFDIRDASWHEEGEVAIRTIKDVTLYDVGPVTFPAYESTQVFARDNGAVNYSSSLLKEYENFINEKREAKARANRNRAIIVGLDL
jgi:phage head maturation protease